MKECEATTMKVDLEEVEQIVEMLDRGEEVGPMILCLMFFFFCSFVFYSSFPFPLV